MQSVSKLSKNMAVSNIMIKPNKHIISLKIWYNHMSSFLFQSTIQLTLLGMHQCSHVIPQTFKSYCSHNSCESFGHTSLHTNPSHCFQIDLETFIQSSCQIAQFLRSKNRQKGDQFFYQICENCNPHSSYPTTAVGECLVDIRFAETCILTLFTFLKIVISLKNGSLLHAQAGSLSMQIPFMLHTMSRPSKMFEDLLKS